MEYIILLFLILFYCLKYDIIHNSKQLGSKSYKFTCLLFVVLIGLRYRVGSDTIQYTDEYELAKTLSHLTFDDIFHHDRYMWGWMLLMSTFKSLHLGIYIFQIFIASIVNVAFFKTISDFSKYKFVGVLIYYVMIFIIVNTEAVRQALSISLFLLSLPYLLNRKFFKYYIYCLGAFSLHESSAILLFLPLFSLFQITNNKVLYAGGIICLTFILSSAVSHYAYSVLVALPGLEAKANYYLGDVEGDSALFSTGFILGFLLNCLLPLFVMYERLKTGKWSAPKDQLYIKLCLISLFFYALSSFLPIFYRFRYFFWLFDSLFIIEWISYFFCKRKIFFFALLILLSFKARTYFQYDDTIGIYIYEKYYPYYSMFNEKKVNSRESAKIVIF